LKKASKSRQLFIATGVSPVAQLDNLHCITPSGPPRPYRYSPVKRSLGAVGVHANFSLHRDDQDSRDQPVYPGECSAGESHQGRLAEAASGTVRINGKPEKAWRINMMPVGDGSFYLYLSGVVRKASGTAVGDRVRVEIEFNASYRSGPQHRLPLWFKQALAANPPAMKNWQALVPSRKKEILRYLTALKSAEVRARKSHPNALGRNGPIYGAHMEERILGGC
jgi:hypothetical protein